MSEVTTKLVLTESEAKEAEARFQQLVAKHERLRPENTDGASSVDHEIHRGLFAAVFGANSVIRIPDDYTLMILNLKAPGGNDPKERIPVELQIRRAMRLKNLVVVLSGDTVPEQWTTLLHDGKMNYGVINVGENGFDDVVEACEFFEWPTQRLLVCGMDQASVESAARELSVRFPNSVVHIV